MNLVREPWWDRVMKECDFPRELQVLPIWLEQRMRGEPEHGAGGEVGRGHITESLQTTVALCIHGFRILRSNQPPFNQPRIDNI